MTTQNRSEEHHDLKSLDNDECEKKQTVIYWKEDLKSLNNIFINELRISEGIVYKIIDT